LIIINQSINLKQVSAFFIQLIIVYCEKLFKMKRNVRVKPHIAKEMGLDVVKSGQYRLSEEDIKLRDKINKRSFKLNPFIAKKLGLKLAKNNYYILDRKQLKEYLNIDLQPIKRLFFDIETSPMVCYSWRVGYNLNLSYDNVIEDWKIICISYKWQDEDKVYSLKWDNNKCDKDMLKSFIKVMNEADEIIAHNGDRFDLKKIRTRCLHHRLPLFPNYRTLDTLKKAKSGFNFPNNKLDTIAQWLGVGAKIKHRGFDMWKDVVEGDKKALKEMVDYCDMDVVVLEDVYLTLQSYIKQNTHVGTLNGGWKYSCPSCGSEDVEYNSLRMTAKGTPKRQMTCKCCSHSYEISNSSYKIFLDKSINN